MTASPRTVQALIIVDMQTAFVSGDEAVPEAAGLLIRVTDLLRRAREAGALVVQLQNDGLPGTADEPYTSGWELFLEAADSDAEWALGDQIDIIAHAADVEFEPPPAAAGERV